MRIITILTLLACWTAAEASSKETPPKLETSSARWVAAKGGKLLWISDSENSDHYPPTALLHVEGLSLEKEHEILEDMRVMSAALSTMIAKAFPDDPHVQNVEIRSYILDGGCLFMEELPFPVSDGKAEAAEAADKPADEVWNSARRKLDYDAKTPYDPEKAERVKETIRSALTLAKNMRHLEADDFIAIAAIGQKMARRGMSTTMLTARVSFGDLTNPEFTWDWASDPSAQGDAVVLSRIMDKLLATKLQEQYSGSPMPNNFGFTAFESFYLKGYGALFFVEALFPIGKKGAGSAPDLWQESLKEMQSKRMRKTDTAATWRPLMKLTEKEAQELLNHTADAVLESLRYGSRIRGMGPDEALIVSVRGFDGSRATFRALKRDVDAYANGSLDDGAFQKKMSIELNRNALSWEELVKAEEPIGDMITLLILAPAPGAEHGRMTLNGETVTMEQLKERFNNAPEEMKKKTLIIASSPKAGHTQVIDAMEAAKRAGFQEVALTIEARKPNVTKGEGK